MEDRATPISTSSPSPFMETSLNYISKNAGSIQLVVIAHDRVNGIRELMGPSGSSALRGSNCSVLICEPHNVL